ncbi:MAG: acetolactate synthase large subunit [Xanthomonadales bacterium]|jgi:acetolactate synthase-1/2/3 large subunit|nr:acetolactate synthase large subunit [Xanthomonadales bacterium]
MNGAENLLHTLEHAGVEVCFANPGTSEMHLVSAIGRSEQMRAILCLYEGVVSGAADGYARMVDKPALTLLHLGSGFANSMANQHNAMRAHVPLVNMVGDHATYHLKYDAPLTSDVLAHARIVSDWARASESADDLALAGAEAVQASLRGAGKVATFIAPANHAWDETSRTAEPLMPAGLEAVGQDATEAATKLLGNGKKTVLFLGGRALREASLHAAGRIAEATGARLVCEVFPARLQRGAGRVAVERLPYFAEAAVAALDGTEQMILVGSKAPVAFFAYPGKPGWLAPESCEIHTLATVDQDPLAALKAVADRLGANDEPALAQPALGLPIPSGILSPVAIGQSVTRALPADAIVVDEAATCGLGIFPVTGQAAAHDWLTLTGGAIGIGLPLALGAAVACPDRKVIALQADGSAMYTLQTLWTMAREQVDVTVVIMNNRSYAILNIELARVGAGQPNAKTLSMLDLSHPDLDFVALAEGMGIRATRATTAEEFDVQFAEAMAGSGPRLIEAMVVQQMP